LAARQHAFACGLMDRDFFLWVIYDLNALVKRDLEGVCKDTVLPSLYSSLACY